VTPSSALLAATLLPLASAVEPPAPIQYDLAVDASVTGGLVAAALALTALQGELTPAGCRWCVPDSLDRRLHDAALWGNPGAADQLSGVLANGVIPVSMLGYLGLSAALAGNATEGLMDTLLVAEAVAASQVLTEIAKEAVARQRPWAYYGPNPGREGWAANLSFFSGHTSFTFSTAAATLTVAVLRAYPGAWIAGTAGLAAAAFVGYLRMAANDHYFTDVVGGALVGGVVGFAVPYLFHGRKATEPGAVVPAPGGLAVTLW